MKTKFAIGCLVQWYEVNIIEEYLETLRESILHYDGEVNVDILVCKNQTLEKCIYDDTLEKLDYENFFLKVNQLVINEILNLIKKDLLNLGVEMDIFSSEK